TDADCGKACLTSGSAFLFAFGEDQRDVRIARDLRPVDVWREVEPRLSPCRLIVFPRLAFLIGRQWIAGKPIPPEVDYCAVEAEVRHSIARISGVLYAAVVLRVGNVNPELFRVPSVQAGSLEVREHQGLRA